LWQHLSRSKANSHVHGHPANRQQSLELRPHLARRQRVVDGPTRSRSHSRSSLEGPTSRPGRESPWTEKLWVSDLRTNMHFTLKTNLKRLRFASRLCCIVEQQESSLTRSIPCRLTISRIRWTSNQPFRPGLGTLSGEPEQNLSSQMLDLFELIAISLRQTGMVQKHAHDTLRLSANLSCV
jgi:hypothetical protein